MSVVLNEPAIQALLETEAGPVGIMLAGRGVQVADKARENASGEIIDIRSGDLLAGIDSHVETGVAGLQAVIGTNAVHRGFAYPAFHDQNGRPWLTRALQEVFS